MSVNIDIELHVTDLTTIEEVHAVEAALRAVIEKHDLRGEVSVWSWQDAPDAYVVAARNEELPVLISGYGTWSAQFEQDVSEAARQAAPTGKVDLLLRSTDEES